MIDEIKFYLNLNITHFKIGDIEFIFRNQSDDIFLISVDLDFETDYFLTSLRSKYNFIIVGKSD